VPVKTYTEAGLRWKLRIPWGFALAGHKCIFEVARRGLHWSVWVSGGSGESA